MNRPEVDPKTPETTAPPEPAKPWPAVVSELLAKAAALCVDHGVDLEQFMRGAWTAYVEGRPGYREFLEEQELIGQLEELRNAGKIGQA